MTLFSLAEIKARLDGEYLEHWQPFDSPPDAAWERAWNDMSDMVEEIQRLRAIRLPSGNDR